MRTFLIVSILTTTALSLTTTATASADEPQAKSFVASSLSYGLSSEGKGLPTSTLHSFIEFLPLGGEWNLIVKGSMATPISTFQPAPQLNLGASVKLSSGFALGATVLYRYIPSWTAPTAAHLAGLSVAPALLLPSKVALVFPLTAARNLTAGSMSYSIGFEIAFLLPTLLPT